jgi:hypothetical protein
VKLELKPEQIEHPNGLEIAVEGFAGDPSGVKPSQVIIEIGDGMLHVHVWSGDSPDPCATVRIVPLKQVPFSAG